MFNLIGFQVVSERKVCLWLWHATFSCQLIKYVSQKSKLIHLSSSSIIHSFNKYSLSFYSVPARLQVHSQITWSYGVWGLKKDRMVWKVFPNPDRMIWICVITLSEATLTYSLWVLKQSPAERWEMQALTQPQIVRDVESNISHLESWMYVCVKGNKISLMSHLGAAFVNRCNLSLDTNSGS